MKFATVSLIAALACIEIVEARRRRAKVPSQVALCTSNLGIEGKDHVKGMTFFA